jgi:hypothetical protein
MTLASAARAPDWRKVRTSTPVLLGSLFVFAASVLVSGPVSASDHVVAVADSSVSCTQVSGFAKFDPRLRSPGTATGRETIHLDLALNGCSSPALPPPITISGTLQGALVTDTGTGCSSTLEAGPYVSAGTLTVRWKAHGAKISPTSLFVPQRVRPTQVQRTASARQGMKVGAPGSPRPSVVGDFAGGNAGRASSFKLSWKRSAATCSTGLRYLPIISGTLAFS